MTKHHDARHLELAGRLRAMLDQAPLGTRGAIHNLFGILYADELSGLKGCELDYIAALGGSVRSMGREIVRGRNLAQFVEVKGQYRSWP